MAKFCVKEYVEAVYEYEMEIGQDEVDELNKYLSKFDGCAPLTVEDVIDMLEDNFDNPRYNEKYSYTYHWSDGSEYTAICCLNTEVYDWFCDVAWDYPVGDIEALDTIGVTRRVER